MMPSIEWGKISMDTNLAFPQIEGSGQERQARTSIAKTLRKIEILTQQADPGFFRKMRVLVSMVLGEIAAVFRRVESARSLENAQLRFHVYMGAEHMGRGQLSGNPISVAWEETIGLLKKLQDPSKKLLEAFEAGRSIWNRITSGESLRVVASDIQKEFQQLEPGRSIAIPLKFCEHATAMMITCTGLDANGKKLFRIDHHNTGLGSEKHPQLKTAEGVELVQTEVSWLDLPEELLCSDESVFSQFLLVSIVNTRGDMGRKNLELLYKLLDRIKRRADPDPKMWSIGQIGGSCSASCLKSLILSQLKPEEFSEFEKIAKTQLFYKALKIIKRGGGDATTRKIALEVAGELQDKEVIEARRQLEISMESRSESRFSVRKTNPLTNYRRAISILKKGKFSEAMREKCLAHIAAAAKQEVPSGIIGRWQFENIIIDACLLWDKAVLTKEQIQILSTLLDSLESSVSHVRSVDHVVVGILNTYGKMVASVAKRLQWVNDHHL